MLNKTIKKHFTTADGSPTLYIEALDEYYHSKHGAIQEAMHVYISMGINHWFKTHSHAQRCNLFEMGFGTGLNTLLSWQAQLENNFPLLSLQTIEAYPLAKEELNKLKWDTCLSLPQLEMLKQIHQAKWNKKISLSPHFMIEKIHKKLELFEPIESIDVIFYDAFGARAQPEMWERHCYEPLVQKMKPGAVFVTYAAKGSLRRDLQSMGLVVELLPGPPGKREMIRAHRTI